MRKKMLLLVVALFAGSLGAFACGSGDLLEDAIEMSVMVDPGGGGFGSGVVFKNKASSFVWTDAHVVEGTQKIAEVIDPKSGLNKTVVTYKDVYITSEIVEDGRKVGEDRRLAKLIRYDRKQDIAVFLVYQKNYGKKSVKFASGIPKRGEPIWHIGCSHGPVGYNSLSDGVVSAVGRLRKNNGYADRADEAIVSDQITGVAHHGNSGGGVYSQADGQCLGLVTEFLNVTDNAIFTHSSFIITPARRLREWAKDVEVEYALDDTKTVPSLKEIMAGPVTVNPLPAPKIVLLPLIPIPLVK